MKKIFFILALVLFLFLALALFLFFFKPSVSKQLRRASDRQLKTIFIENQELLVEVVNTPSSRSRGLSGREQIGGSNSEVDGMLFVFDKPVSRTFWMKEMHFNLDLVWINQSQVVGVTENVPAPEPGTPLSRLPTYQSPQPVELVLEVPAGKFQFESGDRLSLKNLVR